MCSTEIDRYTTGTFIGLLKAKRQSTPSAILNQLWKKKEKHPTTTHTTRNEKIKKKEYYFLGKKTLSKTIHPHTLSKHPAGRLEISKDDQIRSCIERSKKKKLGKGKKKVKQKNKKITY
ncbi:hypothetical protein PDE_00086 [Penicillium oxalicum 114-2]|uniref:Uncharacterized protein n=1 Tax=Penicillium oxalicum (strain 114-2 / CGMCC 5302) TaxID=933388 RepID=S7Z3Q7_PENO1|nr:hypothetical protein PDE_00086 [Penicillium oxalicum 114-2]